VERRGLNCLASPVRRSRPVPPALPVTPVVRFLSVAASPSSPLRLRADRSAADNAFSSFEATTLITKTIDGTERP